MLVIVVLDQLEKTFDRLSIERRFAIEYLCLYSTKPAESSLFTLQHQPPLIYFVQRSEI